MGSAKRHWLPAGRWILLALAWVAAIVFAVPRFHCGRAEKEVASRAMELSVRISNPEEAPPGAIEPAFTLTGKRFSRGLGDTCLGVFLDGEKAVVPDAQSYDAFRFTPNHPDLHADWPELAPPPVGGQALDFRFQWMPGYAEDLGAGAEEGAPLEEAGEFRKGEAEEAGLTSRQEVAWERGAGTEQSAAEERSAAEARAAVERKAAQDRGQVAERSELAPREPARERRALFVSTDGRPIEGVSVRAGEATLPFGVSDASGFVTLVEGEDLFQAAWGDCARKFTVPLDRSKPARIELGETRRQITIRDATGQLLPGVAVWAAPAGAKVGESDDSGTLSFESCGEEFKAVWRGCTKTFRAPPGLSVLPDLVFECSDGCSPVLQAVRQDLQGAQHVLTVPEATYQPKDRQMVQQAVDRAGYRIRSAGLQCGGTEGLDLLLYRAMVGALRTSPSVDEVEGVIADARERLSQSDFVDVEAPLILYRGVARLRMGRFDEAREDFSQARAKAQGRRTRYLEQVLTEAEEFEMSSRYQEWRETGQESVLDQALALWERWDARIARGERVDPDLRRLAERIGRMLEAESASARDGTEAWHH